MFNDTVSATPQSPAHELQALHAVAQVLDLLSDPAATAARVKSLLDAVAEHRTTLDAAQTASADLDKKRQAHLELMTAERAEHDAKLKNDRLAFDSECAAMRNKLTEAQNAAAAAQAEATAARERSVVLNDNLSARLAILHDAATSPLPARH
jgi:chromosome segregation ATPase